MRGTLAEKKLNEFETLINLNGKDGFLYKNDLSRIFFSPALGARVFCELGGVSLHRIDIETVNNPTRVFNNYGGNSLWPTPEGGPFGFCFDGDRWYVQPGVNTVPFVMESVNGSTAKAVKETSLVSRKGVEVKFVMRREFAAANLGEMIAELQPSAWLAYTVDDSIAVTNKVKADDALMSCWTLEQINANGNTTAFVKVKNAEKAIDVDYYDDPRKNISYEAGGFFFKADSKIKSQICVRTEAGAEFIGFYDLKRKLLGVRQIIGGPRGLYFNISANDRPQDPYSAGHNYSIFNGDAECGFFEIETLGGADIEDGYLKGSHLVSKTNFAIFDDEKPLLKFLNRIRQS